MDFRKHNSAENMRPFARGGVVVYYVNGEGLQCKWKDCVHEHCRARYARYGEDFISSNEAFIPSMRLEPLLTRSPTQLGSAVWWSLVCDDFKKKENKND